MRSIEDILMDWKVTRGTLKQGKSCEYFQMDWKNELEHYSALINTLLDEGYTKEDLINENGKSNAVVRMKIVNEMVYSGEGTKFTKSELLKCKDERAQKWELALKVAFPGKVSAPSVVKKPANPAKNVETIRSNIPEDPQKIIIMDTSDLKPIEVDEDFLAELKALDVTMDKKYE